VPDWRAVYEELSAPERRDALSPDEVEQRAVAAFLLGFEDEMLAIRQRAVEHYLACGMYDEALECGFWLGFHLQNRGEPAQAAGWAARLRRVIALDPESKHGGRLLCRDGVTAMFAGDVETAIPKFERAAEIAARIGDNDSLALAILGSSRCSLVQGRPEVALSLVDEAMVLVVGGNVAPQVAGLAYCNVISACMERLDVRRAQEWTDALTSWVADQQGIVAYRGSCLVHRADILRLHGAWPDAEALAGQARVLPEIGARAVGAAEYLLADLARVSGRSSVAEAGYRAAATAGNEVQPGLALLRASQGRTDLAAAGLERALVEAHGRRRVEVLAAQLDLCLEQGDLVGAQQSSDFLATAAAPPVTEYVQALSYRGRGAVLLSQGQPNAALAVLREAWLLWHTLHTPYEEARTRLLIAEACTQLEDLDSAEWEREAARRTLTELGAASTGRTGSQAPDPAALSSEAVSHPHPAGRGLLSPREKEVLAELATGATNRMIAQRLVLSEKTVARHVSNIFSKIGVSSRSAATAYYFERIVSQYTE
jgi:DNA-binding CsgD family transcriptional regulator